MRLGLDLHGVCDANPEFFSALSKAVIAAGGEVHLITGPKREAVEPLLKKLGIHYTHFFSIVEDAEKNDMNIRWDKDGHPWIEDQFWDRSKARYCAKNKISLHIDDTEAYSRAFKTPFALFKK